MVGTTAKTAGVAKVRRTEFPFVRNIRFTEEQWQFLESVVKLTGCPISEYIRRLVDAERNGQAGLAGKDGKR